MDILIQKLERLRKPIQSTHRIELNLQPLTNIRRTLNKIQHTAFNDNFTQNRATIYLSMHNISRISGETCHIRFHLQLILTNI